MARGLAFSCSVVVLRGARHVGQRDRPVFVLAARHALLRHLHADVGGEFLDSVDEAESRVLHQETDGAAVRAAAEAVVELFAGLTVKDGVFSMEGQQALWLAPALAQRHVALDDIDDVDARERPG